MIGATKSVLDFVLRVAFFAAAPFLLVFAAALFPVTGALVQIGLALLAFFAGEALQRFATRSKLAAIALSSQLEFESYYRAHPPRPLLYYVFYPLLFPYWLFVRDARQEFLLFKGYTLASFALLLVSLTVQFFTRFPPELGVRDFLPIAAGTFVAETIIVLMFLMPMVTSVVHFHGLRARLRLALLLVVGAASVSIAIARLERRRDPIVSFATRRRASLRATARPQQAHQAYLHALHAAWSSLPKNRADIDSDGKVEGAPLEAAREALTGYYQGDEAYAFDLWLTMQNKRGVMVVYFERRGKSSPIWLAMDDKGATFSDPKRLPHGAFGKMLAATE